MIALSMPVGSSHGWGICGKYLTRELSVLRPGQVRLITQAFNAESVGDELEYQALSDLLLIPEESRGYQTVNGITQVPAPLLSCIVDKQMVSWSPNLRGTRTVGYTFFEENLLQPAWIENARRNFDLVATGSSWCTEILKGYGLANVHTAIQGIDPHLFFPWGKQSAIPAREFLKDRFVIFSGGKFELRKGQDIVIRAVKVLQDRHKDVVLINAWFNAWQQSVDSMRGSPYLRWPAFSGSFVDAMNRLLAENGLDLSRVLTLDRRANAMMPRIYRNTDVGIFPNRSEGGTNLVLMEYMACGKPVVASDATGHRDIVRPENALVIRTKTENTITGPGGPVARWPEPDLDDAVEKLEWAYQHRQEIAVLGDQAGEDLAKLTWTKSAQRFLELLTA